MHAYMIARFDITDPEGAKTAYPKYAEEAGPAYRDNGARFLARGGAAQPMEGQGRARNVVIEFPDMAAGRRWFASDVYQSARRHRLAVAEGEIVLVEGLDAPQGHVAAPDTGKKGYWIARFDITDPEPLKAYVAGAAPVFERYDARFLARGGAYDALEGQARGRNVLIQFPSVEAAVACYRSDDYQRARQHRVAVSTGEVVVVEGM